MPHKNIFGVTGTMVGCQGVMGLIETRIKGNSRVYEDEFAVQFATEKLAKDAMKGKHVKIAGKLAKTDMGDSIPLVGAVAKVKAKTPHQNLVKLTGICHEYELNPATEDGKKQFGNLRLVSNDEFFAVVAFRGLAAKLDVRAEPGSEWEIQGRLSYREFTDNQGTLRNTTDVIARVAKLLKASTLGSEFDQLETMTMAFETDSGDSEAI